MERKFKLSCEIHLEWKEDGMLPQLITTFDKETIKRVFVDCMGGTEWVSQDSVGKLVNITVEDI